MKQYRPELTAELVEFNEQSNTVGIGAIQRAELTRDRCRLAFRGGEGPVSGRVSLAADIEMFEDDPGTCGLHVDSLAVQFAVDDRRFAGLREALASIL